MAQSIELLSCSACSSTSLPVTREQLRLGLLQLEAWECKSVDGIERLVRQYKFADFVHALAFTSAVGNLAEEFQHHPALLTEWGKVEVSWWTHKINAIHENDLIMAAKTELLFMQLSKKSE
jgi:4a-hydroxytetrahydrobiopterin dehydratase